MLLFLAVGTVLRNSDVVNNILGRDRRCMLRPLFHNGSGYFPANGADLALEISHSRFARVASNDQNQRIIAESDAIGLQAGGFDLFLNKETARNFNLLVF